MPTKVPIIYPKRKERGLVSAIGSESTDSVINQITETTINEVTTVGLLNVVEDTTPQLGGDLDCNGNQLTGLTGVWTAGAGTWTIPAVALGGTMNANSQSIQNMNNSTINGYLSNPATNSLVAVCGGTTAAGAGGIIYLCGKDYGAPGQLIFKTPDAAGTAEVTRMTISGVLATAVMTLSNMTVTGLTLSGAFDANTYNIANTGDISPHDNGNHYIGSGSLFYAGVYTKKVYVSNDGGTDYGTIYADDDGGIILLPDITSGVAYVSGTLNMLTNKIVGVVDPTPGSQEVATAKYVDDAIIAGVGISNVVEDTTPQLGGDLDCNSYQLANVTGTWTGTGTWTIPAVSLGGSLNVNSQAIMSSAGVDITLNSGDAIYLTPSSYSYVQYLDTANTSITNTGDITPHDAGNHNIGSESLYPGKVYFGAAYNYIGSTLSDMDFYVKNTAGNGSVLAMFITDGDSPYLDLASHTISNVAEPSAGSQDAATANYVDTRFGDATYSDVTATRVLGTAYQNTSGFDLIVMLSAELVNGAVPGTIQGKAGTTSACGNITFPGISEKHGDRIALYTFIVKNSWYYKVDQQGTTTPTVSSWVEVVLGD